MSVTIRLIGPTQRAYASKQIAGAPDGHVVKIAAETRRDGQNRLMWAKVRDLRKQAPDMAKYSDDSCKLRFLDALGEEMPYLPNLANDGFFPVGQRSSTLTVAQFSGLIELMNKYAAENDVIWSQPDEVWDT